MNYIFFIEIKVLEMFVKSEYRIWYLIFFIRFDIFM